MGTHDPSRQLSFALAAVHATRRELARTISSLAKADDDRVPGCYERLVAAVEHVFRAEELVAEAIDQAMLHEQQERHARALSALHQAATRIDGGDAALAREALSLLGRFLIMQRDRHNVERPGGRGAAASSLTRVGRQSQAPPRLRTGPPARCRPSRREADR